MTKQPKITHIPKSTLAMIGIVVSLMQIAVALPLHLAAFFRTEPTAHILGVLCFGLTLPFIFLVMPAALVQWGSQPRGWLGTQVRALRKEYGWPRWIWSIDYWDAQAKLNAPLAPVWMSRLSLAVLTYAFVILVALLILLVTNSPDEWAFDYPTVQVTTTFLWMDVYFLPMLISMWRESRIAPEQAAQSGIDHAG